jgi:hypothetical protein
MLQSAVALFLHQKWLRLTLWVIFLAVLSYLLWKSCGMVWSRMKRTKGSIPHDFVDGKLNFDLFITKSNALSKLLRVMERDEYSGLLVLDAPPQSGKSTLILRTLQLLKEKKKYATTFGRFTYYLTPQKTIFYFNGITENILKEMAGGIPRYGFFSDYLNKGTIIIIDQVDVPHLEDNILQVLSQFAAQSISSNDFKVIIAVSHPNAMRQLMELNSRSGVYSLIKSSDLIWNQEEMMSYVCKKHPQLANTNKTNVVNLFKASGCIGLLNSFLSICKRLSVCHIRQDLTNLPEMQIIREREGQWREFQAFDNQELFATEEYLQTIPKPRPRSEDLESAHILSVSASVTYYGSTTVSI